ncbi:MAG: ribonuclease HII [Syntrophomonadaceae bacterium]|nr:ribonuclease HII [Syntrophomonadaceae bacterium]
MIDWEQEIRKKGYALIAGVDEAGRGPLAGPVVAAAVIFKAGNIPEGIKDSKELRPCQRSSLSEAIKEKAAAWSVAAVSADQVDALNILQATIRAMTAAISALNIEPQYIITDAVRLPGIMIPHLPLVQGDRLCVCVGAASILAKVNRDNLMDLWSREYPQYGFNQHKGYPTPEHLKALRKYGPCPIHRKTFKGVKELLGVAGQIK